MPLAVTPPLQDRSLRQSVVNGYDGRKSRRKFRRKTWLRARERESLTLQSLQMDINDLKQQIESLKTLRCILYARVMNDQDAFDNSFVRTVRYFYDVMHEGFHDMMIPRSGGDPVSGRAFMAAILDENLHWGVKQGLGQFISMWQGLTKAFEDRFFGMANARVVQMETTQSSREIVVEAESTFTVRLGVQSAKYVFPNLAGKPDLLQLVLGRTVSGGGKLWLVFELDTRRITRLDMAMNIAEALIGLVRNPLVLQRMLQGSAVVPGHVEGLHRMAPPPTQNDANTSTNETHVGEVRREGELEAGVVSTPKSVSSLSSSRMRMDFILT